MAGISYQVECDFTTHLDLIFMEHIENMLLWELVKWHVCSKIVSNQDSDDVITLYAGCGNVIYETVYIGSNVSW